MTSYMLYKKLASTSLDETTLKRVKNDIKKARLKRDKAAKQLKDILDIEKSNKSCCICLQAASHWIFEENDFNIASNIQYVLGIKITENGKSPQHICSSCLKDLNTASKLKQTAVTTQWRLEQEIELVSYLNEDTQTETSTPRAKGSGYFKVIMGEIIREWKCSKCLQKFRVKTDYNIHKCHHVRKKTAKFEETVCEVCGKRLNNRNHYNTHRKTHEPVLKHKCPKCPYRATWPWSLRDHMRTHTGEKPIRCPHCPMTFARRSNMHFHRRVHFPPRHHCDCGKSFNNKPALDQHKISLHTNLKPHACDTCGTAFSTKPRLRHHELKIHKRPKRRGGTIPTYIMLQQGEQTDMPSARDTFAAELGLG